MPRVARRKDTLAATRKIYRSDDTAIAGVCSGIAEGLDMDPAAVRILAALLVLATFGLFTLVYATLWLVLPKHVAISPETLPCDAYAADGSPRPCFSEDDSPCGIGPHGWSRAGMWIGTAALAVITAFFLTIIAPKVEWWQFLPIAVCLTGAALMITPSRSMARLRRFSLGLMLMFCGLTLLAVSVGWLVLRCFCMAFPSYGLAFLSLSVLCSLGKPCRTICSISRLLRALPCSWPPRRLVLRLRLRLR